ETEGTAAAEFRGGYQAIRCRLCGQIELLDCAVEAGLWFRAHRSAVQLLESQPRLEPEGGALHLGVGPPTGLPVPKEDLGRPAVDAVLRVRVGVSALRLEPATRKDDGLGEFIVKGWTDRLLWQIEALVIEHLPVVGAELVREHRHLVESRLRPIRRR